MVARPKNLVIAVEDGTQSALVEEIAVQHLSDVGEGVKEVLEHFVERNEGVVLPPLSIQVTRPAISDISPGARSSD